jgi:hypothetical protein
VQRFPAHSSSARFSQQDFGEPSENRLRSSGSGEKNAAWINAQFESPLGMVSEISRSHSLTPKNAKEKRKLVLSPDSQQLIILAGSRKLESRFLCTIFGNPDSGGQSSSQLVPPQHCDLRFKMHVSIVANDFGWLSVVRMPIGLRCH